MARAALLRFTKKTYYTHVLMLTPGEVDSTLCAVISTPD